MVPDLSKVLLENHGCPNIANSLEIVFAPHVKHTCIIDISTSCAAQEKTVLESLCLAVLSPVLGLSVQLGITRLTLAET